MKKSARPNGSKHMVPTFSRLAACVRGSSAVAAVVLTLLGQACVHVPTEKEVEQGQTYYDLGVNSLKYSRFEEALENFQRSLTFNPDFADAHMGLGLVWWHKAKIENSPDEFEKARQEFEKAVALRPNFAEAWNNLGALSIDRNDLARAQMAFKKALDDPMYKTPFLARANLGWVYHLQGNDKQALAEIREALLTEPKYCVGHMQLASVLDALHKDAQAAQEWEAFASDCPEDPTAQYHLGKLKVDAGELDDAAKAFLRCRLRALKISPIHSLVKPCTDALSSLPPLTPEEASAVTNEVNPPEGKSTIHPEDLTPQSGVQ